MLPDWFPSPTEGAGPHDNNRICYPGLSFTFSHMLIYSNTIEIITVLYKTRLFTGCIISTLLLLYNWIYVQIMSSLMCSRSCIITCGANISWFSLTTSVIKSGSCHCRASLSCEVDTVDAESTEFRS